MRLAVDDMKDVHAAMQMGATCEAGMLADVIVVAGDVLKQLENLEVPENMRHALIGGRPVAAGGRALAD